MTSTEFFNLKHAIDDEVKRLGWSIAKCKAFTLKHFGKDSRTKMNDAQMKRLLHLLRRLSERQTTSKRLRKRK